MQDHDIAQYDWQGNEETSAKAFYLSDLPNENHAESPSIFQYVW